MKSKYFLITVLAGLVLTSGMVSAEPQVSINDVELVTEEGLENNNRAGSRWERRHRHERRHHHERRHRHERRHHHHRN